MSIVELQRSQKLDINSITIKQNCSIPSTGFGSKGTNPFNNETYLSYFTVGEDHGLKKDFLLNAIKADSKNGIDNIISIKIQKIQFGYKSNKYVMQSEVLKGGTESDFNSPMKPILDKLNSIQAQLNQMSAQLNASNTCTSNSNATKSKLEAFILDIFNNDIESGKEYVKIVISNEGFDEIDVFCNLNENDLKDIGINKKRHRMKIMKKIQQYNQFNQKKKQESEYEKVGGHAMLDVQNTEGKE